MAGASCRKMRREIRRAIRQIEQSVQCPTCEIDTESIKVEFYWNGAVRHVRCPECGYTFRIAFKITGRKFQAQVLLPDGEGAINLDLSGEEQDYLRSALRKLKPPGT